MAKMREKMVKDLNDLIASCDVTIAATAKREGDFKSILVDTGKEMQKVTLNLVNLAIESGNYILL